MIGCRNNDDQLERLNPPTVVPEFLQPPLPPPPAPPPKRAPRFALSPPPPEVEAFPDQARSDTQAWRLELHQLTRERTNRGQRFMGFRTRRQITTEVARAAEMAERLGSQNSYSGAGEWGGCSAEASLGVRLSRGKTSIEFIYACGNMYLTAQRHAGRYAPLTAEMISFLDDLRDTYKLR
jgi:hypothetical protein